MKKEIIPIFFAVDDNYVPQLKIAMNSLMDIARIDLNSVQKHKTVILEFLNDSDIAIKRKSFDDLTPIYPNKRLNPIIGKKL